MKKIYILFAMLFGYLVVQGQRLESAEYFFGNDPGIGNGTALSFTSSDTLNQTFSVSVASIPDEFNTLSVRVKDSLGMWSITHTKVFYKIPVSSSGVSPSIMKMEYFFDIDPGLGNATPINFTSIGDSVYQMFSVPISSLSNGFHKLSVRVQDSLEMWSISHTKIFYKIPITASGISPKVTGMEYFFDIDPGLGNGTPINFTSIGDTVYQMFSVPVSSLSDGFHNLNVRVKDSLGLWSITHTKIFYKIPVSSSGISPNVMRMEYFIDTDPGLGNGTPINFTSTGDSVYQIFSVPVSTLSIGFHNLSVRIQDSLGLWSLTNSKVFYVMNTLTSLPATKIYGIEYFFDDDPGLGNGTPITVIPTDSVNQVFSAPMNSMDSGLHYISVRVMDSIGQWSLILADTFRVLGCDHPYANFSCPTSICIGDTLNISNNTTGTDQWISYQWDMDNDGTNEFSSLDDTAYVYSTPGTYTIKLSAINSSIFSFGCIDTLKTTITVHELPTTNVTAYGPTSFCNGDSVTLAANYGLGYTFQWLDNGLSIPNANSAFYHASANGDFTVEVSSFYGCKDTSILTTVSLYALPNAVITPAGPTSFCQGGSVTLNANTGTGLTYVWKKNGTVISGQTASSLIVMEASNYVVEITNSNNCTSVSSPIATSVNPIPNATITAGGSTTICQGDVLNLYGTSGTGYSYQWLNNASPISGSTSMFHTITQSGNYQVIVTSPNLCTDTSVIETVTVNPTPTSSFTISGQTTFCQGDSTLLDAVGSTGYTYQWKSYGTNLIGATDSTYYIYQSGNYTLVTSNSFGCYTESAAQQITVNAVPGASILPLSSTSFCDGDAVILQANVGAGLSYQWYKNNTMLIGDTTTQIVANTTGAYTVEVGNAVNCASISQAANVNVYPVPTSTFNLPSIGCGGDTITIIYNGTGSSGAFYNWNFDGGIVISGTAQGPFEVIWNTAGFKNVSLSVNENGCISNLNTDTIEIKSIIANITAPNTTVCAGDSVFLYANTGQNLTYQWYQGGLPLAGDTNAYLAATTSGVYKVLVMDSVVGCSKFSSNIQVNVYTTNFNLDFAATPTSFSQPPFNVVFTNSTPNMNNYLFLWEFGDGTSSSFYQPFHQYLFNGNYTVSLYAENTITGCRDTLVKPNYVTCAGGAPNPCNIVAAISPAGPATICFNDSIMLTASSGTNYTYQWTFNGVILPGADSIVFYAKHNGTYRVIITDPLCSKTSPPFILNHYPSVLPIIQTNGAILPCTNDSMELYLGSFYNSYSWSTGKSSNSIWVSQTGYYTVTVTDNYGCVIPSPVYSVNTSFLQPPGICIVGVDTNNHNRIIWEKPNSVLIDSFFVYREGTITGQYDKIGTLPYNAPGIFSDTNSNPQVRAYRYKLAAKDTCGGQTLLSDYHKSIHLTINAGLNGAWNLIWDGYVGFPFGSYIIYRGQSTSNMTLLTQLPSTLSSYTDLNPPTGTIYYQIEVLKTNGCYPDSIFAKANTNYNSSRSNVANSQALVPVYLTADFGANIQSGVWPVQVEFSDATIGFPNSWEWNFGDGNTSIMQNPKHTYNNTGLYTVELIACNGTVCDTMTKVDYINVLPNGIAEINKEIDIGIYPNPNDGMFTVDINSYQRNEFMIVVYNLLGEKVHSDEIQSFKGNHKHNLNLSTLPKGIYNIVVMNDKFKRVGKVVIQ